MDLVSFILTSLSDGEKTAIVSNEQRFTWNELKERVYRLANGLSELGVRREIEFHFCSSTQTNL